MNKVKRQIPGRPRRSQGEVNLQALGQRVRRLRGVATQEKFALALNISQAQLSKYELGQSALPLSLLVKPSREIRPDYGLDFDWHQT